MRVAYYSPMPPERSGIADYSRMLVDALRRHVDVVAVPRGKKRPPRGTDVALYHVGNDPDRHGWIVDALRRRPGVVVLHEFVLHHLVAGITLARGDADGYLDAMEREHGVVGRLLAHGVIDKRVPPLWEIRSDDFPLAGEVTRYATGLIVHSRYVERRVRESGFEGRLWRIPLAAAPVPRVEPADVRAAPLVGSFGIVNPSKRIPQLLEAFARVRAKHPGARLLLVGATSPRFELGKRIERLGLGDVVIREGYVEDARLWALIAACDVCVALRAPTMGETSAAALQLLSLGKPTLVSDVGWFAELPDDVALKIPVDEHEVGTIAGALDLLGGNAEARAAMARAAREYVAREHDLERVAERYAAALEEAAGGDAVRDAVVREVAEAAATTGIAAGSGEARLVAARLREVALDE